jgi:hypothetical protein
MIKRPFLFGLGSGMIIGAVLLQLMLVGERQSDAGRLSGLAGETKTYTQEELDKRIAEERDKVREQLLEETEKAKNAEQQMAAGSDSGEGPPSSGQSPPKQASQSAAKPVPKEEQRKVIVRIPPNTGLSDAAELLEANGVITDKQSCIDLMRSGNGKIRAGYFAFEGKLTPARVKQIVTGTPLPPQAAEAALARTGKDG